MPDGARHHPAFGALSGSAALGRQAAVHLGDGMLVDREAIARLVAEDDAAVGHLVVGVQADGVGQAPAPRALDVMSREVVPGHHRGVVFHETVMAVSHNRLAESIARSLFEQARESARYASDVPAAFHVLGRLRGQGGFDHAWKHRGRVDATSAR